MEEIQNSWYEYPKYRPQESGSYIVTVRHVTQDWCVYDTVAICKTSDYRGNGYELSTKIYYEKVIAWMPCPAPYKESDKACAYPRGNERE